MFTFEKESHKIISVKITLSELRYYGMLSVVFWRENMKILQAFDT